MTGVAQQNVSTIVFFLIFLAFTLALTAWAARRTRSTDDFFAAGRRITAGQNGFALAGDFVAASSFLGVTGIAALSGFDSIIFALSIVAAWPLMAFLLAEPLRALGKYTFADVVEYRLGISRVKSWTALVTVISIFAILTFQMAGAGAVIKLLFGWSYGASVAVIAVFMLVYVLFGGMLATTWVQIVKIILLLALSVVLLGLLLAQYGFSISAMLGAAAQRGGPQVLGPKDGANALQLISLGFATVIGVASLPQVLLRFFTVPDAAVARRSMLYATTIIAFSVLLFVFMGFGIMALIGPEAVRAADPGGNLAVPLLAQYFGGAPLLGFVGAVSFATILAAVCGILLAGSAALAHDLWIGVIRKQADEREAFLVARVATVALCAGGALLAIMVEGQNIFILSSLSSSIAASTIFPVLILSIYWRPLTYPGAVAGMLTGLLSTLLLLYLSPVVQVTMLHRPSAPVNIGAPALVTVPLAFVVAMLVSALTAKGLAQIRYDEIERRTQEGWDAVQAVTDAAGGVR